GRGDRADPRWDRVVDRLLEHPAEVALATPHPDGQAPAGGGQAADHADLVTRHPLDERGAPPPGPGRPGGPGGRLPPGPAPPTPPAHPASRTTPARPPPSAPPPPPSGGSLPVDARPPQEADTAVEGQTHEAQHDDRRQHGGGVEQALGEDHQVPEPLLSGDEF